MANDRCCCQQAQHRQLCKTAEQESSLCRLLKPGTRYLRVFVTVPDECKPDVRVKEIQCVHKFARLKVESSDLRSELTGTARGGALAGCSAGPSLHHVGSVRGRSSLEPWLVV